MKKITLMAAALLAGAAMTAQNVIVERMPDNATGLITSNGSNDAGVYCSDLLTIDSEVALGTIDVVGFASSGTPLDGVIDGIFLYIFGDDGGFPSGDPLNLNDAPLALPLIEAGSGFEFLADDGANTNFRINVTAANGGEQVVLAPGDYWISVGTVGAGDSAGAIRWNWQGSLETIATEPFLIDPDDLFGAGAIIWTNISGLIAEPFPSFNMVVTDEAIILGTEDNLAELIAVSPNPATDRLNLSIPSQIEVNKVAMFDILGKDTGVVMQNGQIDIADLAAGVYLLKVETTQGTLTQKVIKQ